MTSRFTIRAEIDRDDLAAIRAMDVFELEPHLRQAIVEALDVVEYEAQDWMDISFQNPTGRLAGAFQKTVYNAVEAELLNDEPYAQRTNYGFSGMTDSLGRYYPYWPGIAWAQNAVANAQADVKLIYQVAVDQALGRI